MNKKIESGVVIALLQKKGGATKTTTAINLLGALKELGYNVILCDMDKEKPDAIYWADNGEDLVHYVIPLVEDNPKTRIAEFRKQYDVIIIDTPPNFEAAALKAAMVCDLAVIPSAASLIERKALEEAAALALMADKPYMFLASRVTKNTNSAKELIAELVVTGTGFKTCITNSVAMTECQSRGMWVGKYAPGSPNHKQYLELAKEVMAKVGVRK